VNQPSANGRRLYQDRQAAIACLLVCAAAIVPYLSTIDNYFARDDFGVVQLLARKPATYFPRWFVTTWMDDIWGYTPDEVRPFPAVSYQLTALGGPSSPFLHHALNILIHAGNALLVVLLARVGASLSLPAATFAGLVFAILPVQTESVAWITGRVDSMPAFFYLASFLAYLRWRESGGARIRLYLGSLALFFMALFTKQNTITMLATLVSYDTIVRRQPLRPLSSFVAPYIPFVLMTAGYLWLRYLLFGQVAREGALSARALHDFRVIVERHLVHVLTGEIDGPRVILWAALAALLAAWLIALRARQAPAASTLFYFGPVWWAIGVAPIAVAGYASPRHVYLATAGWAIVLGIMFEMLWNVRPGLVARRAAIAAAAIVIVFYTASLMRSIREWNTISAVSHKAVRDVRGVALSAPEGSLLIVGVPGRSWDWALPFSVRPPYVRTDLNQRVFIVSPRGLSCCTAQWFEETRGKLRAWSAGGGRDTAIALSWDPETGALSRATNADSPQLMPLTKSLLDLAHPDELDRNLQRMVDVLPNGSH
jgi:hypothetical protein